MASLTIQKGIELVNQVQNINLDSSIFGAVIGAIIGSILTITSNYRFRYSGKLSSSLKLQSIDYYNNEEDVSVPATRKNANNLIVDFDIEYYNGTETQKCITDIGADFYSGNKKLIYDIAIHDKTKSVGLEEIVLLDTLYIDPKSFIKKSGYLLVSNHSELLKDTINNWDEITINYYEVQHKKTLKKTRRSLILNENSPRKKMIGGF